MPKYNHMHVHRSVYSYSDGVVDVGMDALRAAIHTYSSCAELDGDHLSRCYHSLVQLVMTREGGGDRGEGGDGWRLFSEILNLLESKAKVSSGDYSMPSGV